MDPVTTSKCSSNQNMFQRQSRVEGSFSTMKLKRSGTHPLIQHQHPSDASGFTATSSSSMMSTDIDSCPNSAQRLSEEKSLRLSTLLKREEERSIRLAKMLQQDSYRGFGDDSTTAGFGDFSEDIQTMQKGKKHEIQSGKDEWSKNGFKITQAKLVHMLSVRQLMVDPPSLAKAPQPPATGEAEEGEACFSFIKPSKQCRRRPSLCTIGSTGTEQDDDFKLGGDESIGDFSFPKSKLAQMFGSPGNRLTSSLRTSGTSTATAGTVSTADATAPVSACPITTSPAVENPNCLSGLSDDGTDDDTAGFYFYKPTKYIGRRKGSFCTLGTASQSDEGDDFEFRADESMGDFGKTGTLPRLQMEGECDDWSFSTAGFSISRMKLVRMMSKRDLDYDDDELEVSIQPSNRARRAGEPQLEIVDDEDYYGEARQDGLDSPLHDNEAYDVELAKELKALTSGELASRYIEMQQEAAAEQQKVLLERMATSTRGDRRSQNLLGSRHDDGTRSQHCERRSLLGATITTTSEHTGHSRHRRRKHHSRKKSSSLSSLESTGDSDHHKTPRTSKKTKSNSSRSCKLSTEGKGSPSSSRRRKNGGHKKGRQSPYSQHSSRDLDEEGLITALSLDFNALSKQIKSKQSYSRRPGLTRHSSC